MKNLPSIFYLDSSFISSAYEMLEGKPVPSEISKSEDINGGISLGLARTSATVREIKKFETSPLAMFGKIQKKLEKYPEIEIGKIEKNEIPEYFWTTAEMQVRSSRTTRNTNGKQEIINEERYFVLSDSKQYYVLATNAVYFSGGFDQLMGQFPTTSQFFRARVKAFCRLMSTFAGHYEPMCAPLILMKES